MSDREAMKEALRLLTKQESGDLRWQVTDACDILRAHLAAPCLEVTVDPRLTPDEAAAISSALAAEQPKHPGYILGSHWLETAYGRVCAGEAEAEVLRDCGWERAGDADALRRENERLREALREIADETYDSWTNGAKAQRIAESVLKEVPIDLNAEWGLAMDASAAPAASAVEPATEPAIRARGQEDKT